MSNLPSLPRTKDPQRVYVSGPYSSNPDKWVPVANLVGHWLMAMGHMVFVPHTMTHDWPGLDYEDYMRVDLDMVKNWANALFFIEYSPGANRELFAAYWNGLKVWSGKEVGIIPVNYSSLLGKPTPKDMANLLEIQFTHPKNGVF